MLIANQGDAAARSGVAEAEQVAAVYRGYNSIEALGWLVGLCVDVGGNRRTRTPHLVEVLSAPASIQG